MPDDLDMRRRRALWRAQHRGTRELDLIIGGYAEQNLATMDVNQLQQFETLLVQQEPQLQRWLLAQEKALDVAPEVSALVDTIRKFHGLDVVPSNEPSAG